MKTLKLTLLWLSLSVTAFAQTVVTKEGTGEAAVVNKDELKAYEEAKDDGYDLKAPAFAAQTAKKKLSIVAVNGGAVEVQVGK